MFPPKSPDDQKPGPKQMMAFRCPPELRDYLRSQKAGGYTETEALIKMIEIFRDASVVMGGDWWEVFREAKEQGVSPGTLLGKLASQGLWKKPRRK